MELTESLLKKVMPLAPAARRKLFLPFLNESAWRFGITSELRMTAWLATLAVESAELKYVREIASGAAYEGRRDLGNTKKGDGRRFRGRGLIQLTGRDVYDKFSDWSGEDFIAEPELLEDPYWACISAGWFVRFYKLPTNLNHLADRRDFLAYSIRVNGRNRKTGKPNHWAERLAYYRKALEAFPDDWELTEPAKMRAPVEVVEQERKVPDVPASEDIEYPDFDVTGSTIAPDDADDALPTGDPKTPADGKSGQKQTTSAEGDTQLIRKERPSTFVRWITAAQLFVGSVIASTGAYCGGSEIQTQVVNNAANKAIENADRSDLSLLSLIIIWTVVIVALGLLIIWIASKFYDHSAERSNRLNAQKTLFAQEKDKITTDFVG